jgi:hypothetical protein
MLFGMYYRIHPSPSAQVRMIIARNRNAIPKRSTSSLAIEKKFALLFSFPAAQTSQTGPSSGYPLARGRVPGRIDESILDKMGAETDQGEKNGFQAGDPESCENKSCDDAENDHGAERMESPVKELISFKTESDPKRTDKEGRR